MVSRLRLHRIIPNGGMPLCVADQEGEQYERSIARRPRTLFQKGATSPEDCDVAGQLLPVARALALAQANLSWRRHTTDTRVARLRL